MSDLAAALRQLADRLDTLEPGEVIGRLESIKFCVWMSATTLSIATTAPEPAHELTQQEAARLRPAVGLKTIRFLTRTARVPSVPRGRQRLVRLADLDAYVARCRAQGVALGVILHVSSPRDRRRGAQDATPA